MENNCPHYDYGKSADKCMGAYCTKRKTLVEPEDCEGCEEGDIKIELVPISPKEYCNITKLECAKCNPVCDHRKYGRCEEGEEE